MNDQTHSPLADRQPEAAPQEAPRGPGRARKPFGTVEAKLAWPPIPGYHLRWFNDTTGRIERAKEAGYEHVLGKDGKPVTLTVGVAERGGAQGGFLMKIPDQFYDEDFARKQEAVDMIDLTIWRGRIKDEKSDDRLYVPRDSRGESVIKLTATRGRTE